jgi:hypothetical protein
MKFVPFDTPQNKEKQNISQGTYTQNPPWHQVQPVLQIYSRYPPGFVGNLTEDSILATARTLKTLGNTGVPTVAGTLTINSNAVGSYDYVTTGTTTISSFNTSDWFTNTEDTRSAWIIINGDLTINSGQTVIPSVRKLFTVVYVSGNLTLNGTISMTARGANHSGTGNSGGYTEPVDIRIGTGTFSAVVNPQVPAAGGGGGQKVIGPSVGKNDGTAGTNGGTGGGGSGYSFSGGTAGSGSAGTCFTGGTGGGGTAGPSSPAATDGVANGGKGGDAPVNESASNGGTGNPGGNAGAFPFSQAGNSGTGGTLIVIVEGSFSGTGSVVSNGVQSSRLDSGRVPGGASGGGSVTVLYGTNPSGGTVTATGGSGNSGGNGGAGTARKLAIGSN